MNRWPRLEAYLTSRRNIAGVLLGLGGVVLFIAGVVSGPVAAVVVAGLYAAGAFLVPAAAPKLDLHPNSAADAAKDAAEVSAGLDRLLVSIHGRVAPDIFVYVADIRASIESMLETAPTDLGTADPNVYLIRQTALDYLPAALTAYMALPRDFAEGSTVNGGRTPHDELRDQLRLMAAKLEEVADDIVRHDSDRLFANGRFLAEKFGTSSLNVDAPADAASQSAALPAPTATPVSMEAPPVAIEQAQLEREQEHAR